MITKQNKNEIRQKRHLRIRTRICGTALRPRLSVYRSSTHIYAQIIDDVKGITLASASTVSKGFSFKGNKSDAAKKVGENIAKEALKAGIESVVFDRGGYLYMGRIKSLADGAREAGLKF